MAKMQSSWKTIKNQKWVKYLGWNFLIALLGTAIILDIIFIPKYYQTYNHINDKTITVEVTGQDNQQRKPPLLLKLKIVTKNASLGDLLANYPDTFTLKGLTNVGLGRFLDSFKYYNQDATQIVLPTNDQYYWQILINQQTAPVGIDSITLKNNTDYNLSYTKINK